MSRLVKFEDLGLVDYKQCWDYQEKIFAEIINLKVTNRNLPKETQTPPIHHLIFCEHPHVYTLGKSGSREHVLISDDEMKKIGATFYKINRGGDITYHGPGQIVGYPILDLDYFFTDIHKYLRFLEEAIILTLSKYGIVAERFPGYTGVWIDATIPAKARKICAMGVRCSRWVTMHGFAFNVNTDLSYFNHIVPCGIKDKDVTSLERELGRKVDLDEVKTILKEEIRKLFDMQFIS
ncbi:MAG: lipoyl(octanoyl) transferase LipB [Bacteroidia bacterium]